MSTLPRPVLAVLGAFALFVLTGVPPGARAEGVLLPAQFVDCGGDGIDFQWEDVIVDNGQVIEFDEDVQGEGPRIFVPEPKGAGDTLDEGARRGERAVGDTVTTVRGDRIVGRVLTIEAGGKLRLSAPHFEGEVAILASALDRVDLIPKERSKGDDEVTLSNGDRIVGEVAAITPEAIVIESKATGPVKVARTIVESILFSRATVVSLESNFEQGKMDPWTARGDGWTVSDGALQCFSQGNCVTVLAKFDQKDAVTMEAHVQSTMGRYVNCELVLFADRDEGQYGQNSLVARFYSSQFYLMITQNGNCNSIVNRSLGNVLTDAVIRLAYDPGAGKAHAWINTTDLGEFAVPQKLPEGHFVMFNARYPCRVQRLRVMQGIVGPASTEKEDKTDGHVVRFANRDRVAAAGLALADGKLTLKTAFGDLAAQVDKVHSISFNPKGLEKPRRRKDDVWVDTADSRFTLQFERLTDEALLGKSSSLGEVKVRRDCLKSIRFNIYK